jgi:hypothetical protein
MILLVLQEGPPGLVIDNIPIGQHVAKYRLKHDLSRGVLASADCWLVYCRF